MVRIRSVEIMKKKDRINKAKSMISSSTLGGRNLKKSRWRGERHGGNKKEKRAFLFSAFFYLSIIVDECCHELLSGHPLKDWVE